MQTSPELIKQKDQVGVNFIKWTLKNFFLSLVSFQFYLMTEVLIHGVLGF